MTIPAVYERTATVTRVVDGDTLHIVANLGCDVALAMTVRLAGVNAPETSTPEGRAAQVYVAAWVADHGPVFTLRTVKDRKEKWGRYLADLIARDGPSLCRSLIDAGHAVPYMADRL